MKNILLLVGITCILSSCATLINKDTVDLTLYSEIPANITHNTNTFYIDSVSPRLLNVQRSKKPLHLHIQADSCSNDVYIPRKYDGLFYAGFITGYFVIFDYFVGKSNNRIYSYSNPLLIDKNLNVVKAKNLPIINPQDIYPKLTSKKERTYPNRGDMYLDLSFPYANQFTLVPDEEKRESGGGFIGMRTGLDYYYIKNRFISINASTAFTNPIPVPMGVCYYGNFTREWFFTSFVDITHNHRIKNFTYGYGTSLNHNCWVYEKDFYNEETDTWNNRFKRKVHQSLGLMFSADYFLSNSFYMGVLYRPSFIRFNTDKTFNYEHLISITAGFKIRLKKGKK